MTVTSVAIVTTKSLFGMCDCTVYNNVGTGDVSLVLGSLHGWTCARAIARVLGHGLVNAKLFGVTNLRTELNGTKINIRTNCCPKVCHPEKFGT